MVIHTIKGEYRYEENVYETLDVSDPAHPYKFCFGYNEAIPHWHEHVELLYFQGDGTFICDREEYTVKAGDLAVFNSNDVHAVSLRDGFFYDCLIVDSTFLAKNDIDVTALRFTPHIRDEMAEKLFANIASEVAMRQSGGADRFSPAATKAAILALMVYLCRGWSRPDDGSRPHGDSVKRAIGYIKSRMSEPLTVDEIADHVKVSKYYFCREFHKETGYTVVKFINNLRCQEAEKLLRGSEYTVSEIARMCGFENLSYFTRTFKSIVGCTPSALRM